MRPNDFLFLRYFFSVLFLHGGLVWVWVFEDGYTLRVRALSNETFGVGNVLW